jgi:hypothetical protein
VTAVGLIVPAAGVAAQPPCLAACEGVDDCCGVQPCIRRPCENYLGCKAEAQADLETCIDEQERCQPGPPGRCTVILACVKACERNYRIDVKACRKRFLSNTNNDANPMPCGEPCKLRPRARERLATICESCTSVTVVTTTVTSTSSTQSTTSTTLASSSAAVEGFVRTTSENTVVYQDIGVTDDTSGNNDVIDACMRACLQRIDSLRDDYERCDDACERSGRALSICQRASRNCACEAIKARCSTDGDNPDEAYRACCKQRDTCVAKEDSPCKITTTTTSTTSTSTSTVKTTSSTTTTTSAPF